MRNLFIILFSLFCFLGYSQDIGPPVGYIPIKGEGYFLRDAQGRIISDESGGVLSIVYVEDTASANLVLPPDTFQVFNITMVNPGDESTPPLATEIQAYYSLEETAGGTAFDSAASYDGTLMNTPTQNETGISNLCYSFASASGEYIDLGAALGNMGTDDLTVIFWTKATTGGSNGGIIGKAGSGDPRWYIRNQSGSTLKGVANFTGSNIETVSNGNLSVDVWYFVVYRWDRDGYATLHINNVLQNDQDDISAHSAVNVTNSNDLTIGNIGNATADYYHNGFIDELSIYNRLISAEEISNLYNVGVGKFWPYGVSGGDTLNMALSGEDTRSDSVRVLWKYESYPTTRVDGNLAFAFNMDDVADYYDTTFVHDEIGDTTEWWAAFTGFNDDWTSTPNVDTVFIDSSDINPPIQDPGGFWDTIFYQDFEHRSPPVEYTFDLQSPDFNNHYWFDSDHRYPVGWQNNTDVDDSIIIDPITGSNVYRLSFDDAYIDGYWGNGVRGGEGFFMDIGAGYHEIYLSWNMMLRPGWDAAQGGKFPGMAGYGYVTGPNFPHDGFKSDISWMWYSCPCPPGTYNGLMWYYLTVESPGPWSEAWPWWDFQPAGDGLQYYDPGTDPSDNGLYYMDVTDSTWFNITLRFSVNTFTGSTPNNDGLMEGFINGHLVTRKSGLILCNKLANYDIGINSFWGRTMFGDTPPQRDEWELWDDIIIFTYDVSVDVPRGQEVSPPGRVLNLPNWPKTE